MGTHFGNPGTQFWKPGTPFRKPGTHFRRSAKTDFFGLEFKNQIKNLKTW